MKRVVLFFVCLLFIGCAKVQVQAPKEPIKVDISMRLDIYQHVQKDIDAIEDIVSGSTPKIQEKSKDNQSLLDYFLGTCFAQDGLSPEVQQAALRRKDRRLQISSFEEKGIIGENGKGLLEMIGSTSGDSSIAELVKQENDDRMIIYQALASKNQTSINEIQKMYAQRLQNDAPVGTPIEAYNQSSGSYEWKIK